MFYIIQYWLFILIYFGLWITYKFGRVILIYVSINFQNDQANGTIYIDDYESFDYESNEFNYLSIQYSSGSVSIR